MITKKEFAEDFAKGMKGEISTKEWARRAIEYLNSPDFMRWKAAQAAKDLKRWREGREYLMNLIESEKKAGTNIDYELVKLREGHDSVKVIVNGRPTVCFPSYFSKEFIDMNWTHVLEAKDAPQ